MFQLLRNIENAEVGVFAGYADIARARVVIDGEESVVSTAEWEPITARGGSTDWPKSNGPQQVVKLSAVVAADSINTTQLEMVTDAIDGLLVERGRFYLTAPCTWEMV